MISFTPATLSNVTQLGGNQSAVRTAALANGGYVVAWQSNIGISNNVFFQRYDAAGVQVGALTQITNPSTNLMQLNDIAVADDGTFSILTQGSVGPAFADQRLFVSSFFGSTGGPSGAQAQLNLTAFSNVGISGAQLLPGSTASALVVVASVNDNISGQDLIRASVTTAGVVTSAPALVTDNYSGAGIIEVVENIGAEQFAISDTTIIDTVGSFASLTGATDIISLAPGVFVVARGSSGAPQVTLTLFSGTAASINTYGTSGGVTATNAQGVTTAGAQSFDIELVDLGAGRILVVWVADGGDTAPGGSPLFDGVFAQVYNMNTGAAEGAATQIQSFGLGSNDALLQSIALSADMLGDGRVVVGMSYSNGLSGQDVFSTVLDARAAGISVAATTATDVFIGSAFDDVFTGASGADTVIGGLGSDTVVFNGVTARTIDLEQPAAFPLSLLVMSGIENLTGGSGADDLRGSSVANALSGGVGDDSLLGRGGNDVLAGDTGADLLRGEAQNDVLSGGADNDQVFGGADNDLLFGGVGLDLLKGDAGDDSLNGDADNDRLFGGDGADLVSGDLGNDIVAGGAGDDVLFGGVGNDTLQAETGADLVFGGVGNDVIRAVTDVQQIDGGTGLDTVVIANATFTPGTGGVHLDLTGDTELLGQVDTYTSMLATISGVENVTGSTGDDFIAGDALVNVLRGGNGTDFLFSRGGNDTLFGNAGADSFVFATTTDGADVIGDFAVGEDQITLLLGGFGDLNAVNIAARLTINATGTVGASANAQLIFDNAGAGFGQLSFDADGNGAGAAVLLARLTLTTGTLVAISATDFAFI